jgi:hypothetical protein
MVLKKRLKEGGQKDEQSILFAGCTGQRLDRKEKK